MKRIHAIRGVLYTLVQVTWGFPQTVLGFVVFLAHAKRPHIRFHGSIVTTWESRKALSLGPFVFLNGPASGPDALEQIERPLLVHEYGHTVQSLILGPAYLVVIGLPSVIWLNSVPLRIWRERGATSYYAFYSERWANWLAELVLDEVPAGKL